MLTSYRVYLSILSLSLPPSLSLHIYIHTYVYMYGVCVWTIWEQVAWYLFTLENFSMSVSIFYVQDILLHIHNNDQNQEINIDTVLCRPYSNFPNCPYRKKSSARSNPGSCVAFSCHVSLVPFNLDYFLGLCTRRWYFWSVWASCFIECPSVWICWLFPHD